MNPSGGLIQESQAINLEFVARIQRQIAELSTRPRTVECLPGGGLYRREALAAVGYMSDRNLHAFEEYDLGARLREKGWKLLRMPDRAAYHYSHQISTPALLWLRVRSGTFLSYGKLIRASYEQHYVSRLLRDLRAIQLSLAMVVFWTFILLLSVFKPALALASSIAALISFVALMAVKRRSLALGAFTVATWHLGAAGLIVGLFKARKPPEAEISYTEFNAAEASGRPAMPSEPHASLETSPSVSRVRAANFRRRVACADVSDSEVTRSHVDRTYSL